MARRKTKKKGRSTKHHAPKLWAVIRSAYRRGEGSYSELAERFGVGQSTLANRALAEKWSEERERFQIEASRKAADQDSESIATMLSRHRRFARRLMTLAEQRLDAAEAAGSVSASLLHTLKDVHSSAARQERLAAGIEPAKPVMAFETATDGTVLCVKRRRNPEVPAPAEQDAPRAKPVAVGAA